MTIDYRHYCVVSSSWKFKSKDAVSTCLCLYNITCFVYFKMILFIVYMQAE